MAAHAKCIEIAVGDRPVLEKLASSRTAERRLVERAQIVLLALVLHALIRAKVFVFAWAFDAVYGSDYSVRLSRDPSAFGQDEPEAS